MTEWDLYAARAVQDISQSSFKFSTALQENLATDGNLVFSPLSLGLVLLMARFGARGRTASQIETALKLPYPTENEDDLVPYRLGYARILQRIKCPSEDYKVTVATRMYTDKGFKVDETFRKISKNTLDTGTVQVNFTDGVKTAEVINSWARSETKGKIKELFSPGSFGSDTKIVLVNTIYLKAPWKYPFEHTEKASFKLTNGQNTEVDMMVMEDDFASGDVEELNAKIVVLPYKGGNFSMHVLIPAQGQTLDGLLRALRTTSMEAIGKHIRNAGNCDKVKLHFPKFKIESTHDLVGPLEKMGVTDMFSESMADFSGIIRNGTKDPAPKLFVSQVVQKAFIVVDEKGTEAAAATGIRAGVTCFPTITKIKADRPFYYQIVEEHTKAVLFAGVVRDPNASGGAETRRTGVPNEDEYSE